MNTQKSSVLLAILLMISVGNYFRIVGNENIRIIQFLSIFAIGALTELLIQNLAQGFKERL